MKIFPGLIFALATAAFAAEPNPFLDRLEQLDHEESYTELVKFYETSQRPAADLSPRELFLVMDGYFGVDNYEQTMAFGDRLFAKSELSELGARTYMFAARQINREKDGLARGLAWIEKNPDGKAIYKDVAIGYTDVHDYPNALRYARIGQERLPDDQRIAGVVAYATARAEGVEAALALYESWKKKVGTPETYFLVQLAKGLFDQKDFKRLLPLTEEILAATPAETDAARLKIVALRRLERLDESLKFGTAWYDQYKPDSEFCNEFGTTLYLVKDYPKAKELFQLAVKWDEWNATAFENLLVTYNELDAYGQTIESAAKWRKDHASAWTTKMDTQLGNSYTWLEVFDLAEIYYGRALRADPESAAHVRDVMYVVRKQGRPAEAIALGETWLKTHKKDEVDGDDVVAELQKARTAAQPPPPTPATRS